MRRIATIGATAVLALLTPLLATAPASAEKVTVQDPRGNDHPDAYDITSMTVDHRPDRVQVEVRADRTPYIYFIRTDVPGGRNWDYMLIWSAYYPKFTTLKTRHQYETESDKSVCQTRNARDSVGVVKLAFRRSCLENPTRVRMQAAAWDDEAGVVDTTHWSPWASRA